MSEEKVREALNALLVETGCQSVVDIGCGPGKYINTMPPSVTTRIGIDAWPCELGSVEWPFVRARGETWLYEQPVLSYDAVIMLDVIEHLDKIAGFGLINNAQRTAAKLVVILTPEGYVPQYDPTNPYQEHRSGWFRDDLEASGFIVETWEGFHDTGNALWATWRAP